MKTIALVFTLGVSAAVCWGQTSVGRIVGTVTDASGARIGNAKITATNERTGQERSALTNNDGAYSLPQLEPSTYSLQAERDGFNTTKVTDFVVQVGQELTQNLVLGVAGVASAVTVESGSLASVDTSSARVGVNISEREVAQFPLNGRQVSQLYLLAPGR